MRSIQIFFLSWLGLAGSLTAQVPDTSVIRVDTLEAAAADTLPPDPGDDPAEPPNRRMGRIGRWFTNDYPDPGKAALFSAVLPGAGQAYNRKWWKLPLVYGALGGLVYWEIDNVRTYRELRDNYKWIVDEDPATVPDPEYDGVNLNSLRGERDNFRKYVELTALVIGIAYLLNITDAFVDAHLARFDVSDDLSLRIAPGAGRTGVDPWAPGLGLQLSWGRHRPASELPRHPVFITP